MKNGELYSSPLTFNNIDCYFKASFQVKSCNDIREIKMSHSSVSSVGQVHEVRRITKGYLSDRVISLSKTITFFSSSN